VVSETRRARGPSGAADGAGVRSADRADASGGAGLVSVVVPAYNERGTAEELLKRVAAVALPKEVIVVDDGSTDGTRDVLRRLRRSGALVFRLVLHDRNLGKGAALRSGFARASGDIVVIQDADLEYDPADIPRLVAPIRSGAADAVYGSRFANASRRTRMSWHGLGNRALTALSNWATGYSLTDMETCYKAVRRDLLQSFSLHCDRFGIEPEITARLAQARARLVEVPVSYAGRDRVGGKKIGWRDGLAAPWHIVRSSLVSPAAPEARRARRPE